MRCAGSASMASRVLLISLRVSTGVHAHGFKSLPLNSPRLRSWCLNRLQRLCGKPAGRPCIGAVTCRKYIISRADTFRRALKSWLIGQLRPQRTRWQGGNHDQSGQVSHNDTLTSHADQLNILRAGGETQPGKSASALCILLRSASSRPRPWSENSESGSADCLRSGTPRLSALAPCSFH